MNSKRGGIYLACLDPTVGAEINKTRPVVVVSNNSNNDNNFTVTILPITSNTTKIYPFEVFIPQDMGNLTKDSKIKADQIRTIDKARLVKEIGVLPIEKIIEMENAIKIHLEL